MSMKKDILAFKYGNRAVEGGKKKDPGEIRVLGHPWPLEWVSQLP